MNLTSTDEKRGLPCQTTGFGVFSHQSVTEFENHVQSIQMKLDKAVTNDDKDWENREYRNAKDSIYGSAILTQLFRRQKGKCSHCKKPIIDKQVRGSAIEKHHLKPHSEGGDWKLGNLRLFHAECHNSIDNLYSRKERANFINKGVDYLSLMRLRLTGKI